MLNWYLHNTLTFSNGKSLRMLQLLKNEVRSSLLHSENVH